MNIHSGHWRIGRTVPALLAAGVIMLFAGYRSAQTEDSERLKALHAYFVTVEEEFHASEDPPPSRVINPDSPLGRGEYVCNLEIRYFRVEAPDGELQEAVETLKDAGSTEKRARLAETDPRYELRRKPDLSLFGTEEPSVSSRWRTHGGYAIITGEFETPPPSLDAGWPEMKRSAPSLYMGRPIQDGFLLKAHVDSYDGDTGEGKVSVAYVHVRDGWVKGYLILEEEPFTSGESLCFTRRERCNRILACGLPQKLAPHFRGLEALGDND